MKKGFKISCQECNEEVDVNQGFSKEGNHTGITYSVIGNYPFQSLYLVCSNCKNEIEIDS